MKYIEITKQEAEKVYKNNQIHISVYRSQEDKGTVEFVKSYDVSRPKDVSWASTLTLDGIIKEIFNGLPDNEAYVLRYYMHVK